MNVSDSMTQAFVSPDLYRALEDFRTSYYFLRANRSYLGSIKSAFVNIVTLLLNASDQHRPPYDLEKIGRLLRVHTIEESEMVHHGELTPDYRGFTLRLQRSAPQASHRTTLAHELGHALFYDLGQSPPSRAARSATLHASEDKEEWLCFDFARELLMPASIASESLQTSEKVPSLNELRSFCDLFGVSLTLACRRIFRDLRAWPNAMIFIAEWDGLNRSWKPVEIFKGRQMSDLHAQRKRVSSLLPNTPGTGFRSSRKVVIDGKVLAMETAPLNSEFRVLCLLRKRKII